MEHKKLEKYFFFVLFLTTIVCALVVLKPFLTVIVVGASLAIVFSPLFLLIKKHTKNTRWIAATVCVLVFVVLLTGPLFTLGTMLVNESQNLYVSLTSGAGIDPVIDELQNTIQKTIPFAESVDIRELGATIASSLSSNIGSIFKTTISTFISLILVIMSMFYFLKDGEVWRDSLIKFSPLKKEDDEKIIKKLTQAVNGVIRGYIVIGFVQGILMGIGLWIFGVPNPVLWGTVAGMMSLIPTVGTSIISIPSVIYLFATGSTGMAIGLLLWAIVFVGLIDNVLNPILVSSKVDIPPLLILFSVLGGIALLGPVGVLIGPLVISFLVVLVDIYKTEYVSLGTE